MRDLRTEPATEPATKPATERISPSPVPAALSAPAAGGRRETAVRLLGGAVGGLLLLLAFPPYSMWPAAPASVAALVLAARGAGPATAATIGLVHGLAFFVPLLHWSGIYVGPAPWLILAACQAAFHAPLGAVLALVTRLPGWPLWVAAAWVGEEALRARLPYSGFSWGRLGFGLADSPYLHLAPLGGPALMTFAAALTGALVAAAVGPVGVGGHRRTRLLAAAGAVAVALVPLAVPLPVASGRGVVVAVVQGNVPRPGLDFNAERRAVLGNHARRTHDLAARVRAGELPRPDVVLWPENSSDLDPFRDAEAFLLIDAAVRDVGVPVVVGAVLQGPGPRLSNVGLVWDPDTGPGQRYVKRSPVPFAEYIPLRPVARLVSAEVDRVRDFAAGDTVGLLDVGGVRLGDLICFEVSEDGLVRDVVGAGAQLVAVQTNNATFGFTPQSEQQLAMSRVRAAEHGRSVLVAATSGVSAVVAADGSVLSRSELFTPAVLVATVPTTDARTAATRLGSAPEWGLATLAGVATAIAIYRRPVTAATAQRRRRRGRA